MTTVAVDVAVARPVSFALTILGSALFVVSLPVALPSGCVDKAAQTLVVGAGQGHVYPAFGRFRGLPGLLSARQRPLVPCAA